MEASEVFKRLCNEKRKTYQNNIIATLSRAKERKILWQAINSFKFKQNRVAANIGTDE